MKRNENTELILFTKENTITEGLKDGTPIVIGYIPLGLAFGVIAANTGLTIWQIFLMSLLIFSGSGQYIAVGMLAVGAPIIAIIITTTLINSRYLLLSASLAPYVKKLPAWMVAFLSHGITDEVYAVSLNHFKEYSATGGYIFGVALASHLSWILSTTIGALMGNFLGDVKKFGINFALTAMFISLLVMQINNKMTLFVAFLGGVLAIVIYGVWGTKLNILIAAIISATIGVGVKQWLQRS